MIWVFARRGTISTVSTWPVMAILTTTLVWLNMHYPRLPPFFFSRLYISCESCPPCSIVQSTWMGGDFRSV